MFMQSNGGLVDAQLFQGKDAILSGPAGGIVGGVRVARSPASSGSSRSTWAAPRPTSPTSPATYERTFESEVAGVRLRAPMMAIHTVAAGGGSILTFDGARFRVGPESAGANPGPACYRRGGPLTVTDANLMVGKLHPRFFPNVFGPNADRPLDGAIVRREVRRAGGRGGARDRRRAHARRAGARLPRDRGRQHGQCDQEDLDPARPRHLGLRALLLRRRRRPARLPGRRCAGAQARCWCTRSRACCRPTAWGSPTCARSASGRSRRRWTMR